MARNGKVMQQEKLNANSFGKQSMDELLHLPNFPMVPVKEDKEEKELKSKITVAKEFNGMELEKMSGVVEGLRDLTPVIHNTLGDGTEAMNACVDAIRITGNSVAEVHGEVIYEDL